MLCTPLGRQKRLGHPIGAERQRGARVDVAWDFGARDVALEDAVFNSNRFHSIIIIIIICIIIVVIKLLLINISN